jgi:4-hydroxy-tetrahydrodipicolinate synthase
MWGARSWIAGGSGFLPQEHSRILALATSGELPAAREALAELLAMLLSLEHGPYMQKVRAGLEAHGLPAGYPRAPMQRLSESEAAEFVATLSLTVQRA